MRSTPSRSPDRPPLQRCKSVALERGNTPPMTRLQKATRQPGPQPSRPAGIGPISSHNNQSIKNLRSAGTAPATPGRLVAQDREIGTGDPRNIPIYSHFFPRSADCELRARGSCLEPSPGGPVWKSRPARTRFVAASSVGPSGGCPGAPPGLLTASSNSPKPPVPTQSNLP